MNAVCIAWLAWKRGALDYDTAFGQADHQLGATVMKLMVLVTSLLFISAIFLADALRRLKK